ncbi:MAG: glycosyltransferase [Paracoccus sp. (in: a-proteobacteria)]|uniref:glycosyltransferase family 2 protein n=1 Tax=Paracoccus sp. TaxID=267 RepID=UPI0026DEC971|nr:glycosyltransferase [Paracoccus sp. (in: a-proteobacteria)]MDO5631427.1 glycosyltransferase [Paracoccus sp. (in: a-proteobacteria)]
MSVGAVIIGRNEGERLVRALAAARRDLSPIVYVDSGSTDDSVQAALAAGAVVVELDMSQPFTAARARNAGFAAFGDNPPDFVQFIDGDCEMVPGWTDTALTFLAAHPKAAIAAGRVRERHPEASVYNRLCDAEWDTPIGESDAVGGIFMARSAAFAGVGGFDAKLIAGEEPELCRRLRGAGWTVWRLDAEMTLHDAAMTRFGQWWRRARRGGHAAAEGAALPGPVPDVIAQGQVRRALIWGFGIPLAVLLAGLIVSPWALLLLLIYPVQIVRLARRRGFEWALFNTLGKFPEALGALQYHWGRFTRRRQTLIEYK